MNGAFSVNGRTYPLHFTVNHICMLEETVGKPLPSLLNSSLSSLRDLLWCGLMDERITRETAGQWMQDYLAESGSLKELSALLASAMEDAGFFQQPGKQG